MKEKFEKIKRKFIEISESNARLSKDEDLDQSSGFFFQSTSLTQQLRLRLNDA
jgi:hypothetical protein